MAMRLLVVGTEKELKAFEPVVQAAARKYVGPVRIASAFRAHEAVAALNSLGRCDLALLSNHFTAPGKEEFSDALRKVLKDKNPDTPVVCWGNPSKGGKQGEHYHYTLEGSDDVAATGDILARAKAGELSAEYGGKRKSTGDDPRRKSVDSGSRRPSMDNGSGSPRPAPLTSAASMRRKSFDNNAPGGLPASGSMRRQSGNPLDDAPASPGLQAQPSFTRMGTLSASVANNSAPPLVMGSLGSMTRMGSMRADGFGAAPQAAPPPPPIMVNPMGSMNSSMGAAAAMGMGPMMMNGGGGGGMMPAVMGPMMGGSMMPTMGLASHPAMMSPSPSMHMASQSPSMPRSLLGSALGGLDVGALLTSPPAGGNAELIRMLAEEVVRLRKALEEKKARLSSTGVVSVPQQQQPLTGFNAPAMMTGGSFGGAPVMGMMGGAVNMTMGSGGGAPMYGGGMMPMMGH